MFTPLDPKAIPVSELTETLAGPVGWDVIRLVVSSCFDAWDVPVSARRDEVMNAATELGIMSEGRLTALGEALSHPMRELLQWEERGRNLPMVDRVDVFRPEYFDGREVLEVGSGFGVNLLNLQHHATKAVGVEIDPIYVEVAPVLAAAAGEATPEVVLGQGESIPFDDNCFDQILILGALQYMDIKQVLREMQRVVRPGGEIIALLGHLSGHLRDAAQQQKAHPNAMALVRETREIATMISYPWLGRLLGKPGSPVYPPRHRMRRFIEGVGLELIETRRIDLEALYIMRAS